LNPQKIFVPLTINQLNEAHAFLREQTEDGIEGDTINTERSDPEDEIIEGIDSDEDCMGVEDELAELSRLREDLSDQHITCAVSTLVRHLHPAAGEDNEVKPARINGFRRSNGQGSCLQVGLRRFLYGMSNAEGLRVQRFCWPSHCWKDSCRVPRQHLRHPRRIRQNIPIADSSS